MKKSEKTFFVANLTEELKSVSSIVLVNYSGLSVKMQQDLKKRLKEIGATMFVAKNTLFKLAAQGAKLSDEIATDTVLSGPTAYIMTENDPISPLQVLYKFAKEFELPQFKVGIVEGNFQDKNALETLAQLPSKDVLYAQVVGSISAPMYGIVGVLQANLQNLLSVLKQASEKKPN
jgi:large subunit ribosomal protein L10